MDSAYFEDKIFKGVNFSASGFLPGDYEGCRFVNCNLSDTDLSNVHFTECEFEACNLSMAKLVQTVLNAVSFRDCKLTGVHFEHCNEILFTVGFENCSLDLSSFYMLKVKNTLFKNVSLREVDFTKANLANAVFDNCDLSNAVFENSILEKADFRTSCNYSIDPETNRIKKARFSLSGVAGLLDKYDIEVE